MTSSKYLQLLCNVYGEMALFKVNISSRAYIYDLKKMIVEEGKKGSPNGFVGIVCARVNFREGGTYSAERVVVPRDGKT